MHDPRFDKLADVLVNYSTRVKPGDLVAISSDPIGFPLIKAVYEKVLEAGGNPYWSVQSEELTDTLLERGSDEQIKTLTPIDLHEVETVDCAIRLISEVNTRSRSRLDSSRQALLSSARKPWYKTFMRRMQEGELRWVLAQYPSVAAAQEAEMSQEQFAEFVFRGCLTHLDDPVAAWRQVKDRQERIREWLQSRKTLHFRVPGPDGSFDVDQGATELEVGVDGATWINCFGDNNMPDGEVFTGPQDVNGVVNYNFPAVYRGRSVEGARLRFKGGRVVDASATKNEDYLIQMLDQDEGARNLGEIAIGTNDSIQEFTGHTLFDEKIGGTFHAACGAGYPKTGNTNESGLHWDMVCDLRPRGDARGATIAADGEVFSRDGEFLNPEWRTEERAG